MIDDEKDLEIKKTNHRFGQVGHDGCTPSPTKSCRTTQIQLKRKPPKKGEYQGAIEKIREKKIR